MVSIHHHHHQSPSSSSTDIHHHSLAGRQHSFLPAAHPTNIIMISQPRRTSTYVSVRSAKSSSPSSSSYPHHLPNLAGNLNDNSRRAALARSATVTLTQRCRYVSERNITLTPLLRLLHAVAQRGFSSLFSSSSLPCAAAWRRVFCCFVVSLANASVPTKCTLIPPPVHLILKGGKQRLPSLTKTAPAKAPRDSVHGRRADAVHQ